MQQRLEAIGVFVEAKLCVLFPTVVLSPIWPGFPGPVTGPCNGRPCNSPVTHFIFGLVCICPLSSRLCSFVFTPNPLRALDRPLRLLFEHVFVL